VPVAFAVSDAASSQARVEAHPGHHREVPVVGRADVDAADATLQGHFEAGRQVVENPTFVAVVGVLIASVVVDGNG
jgi:hypothetical protein